MSDRAMLWIARIFMVILVLWMAWCLIFTSVLFVTGHPLGELLIFFCLVATAISFGLVGEVERSLREESK